MLLSDEASPGVSERRLRRVGGKWSEPFVLPVDPELVMQRTGYACMDEDAFPFGSVDSEEVDSFYDQTAVVEDTLGERRPVPLHGAADEVLRPTLCATTSAGSRPRSSSSASPGIRRSPTATATARSRATDPDLAVYEPDFAPSRTTYRYIHASGSGGCEVAEGSVGGTGWRRLLQFATSDENVGERELTIGGVDYTLSGQAGGLDRHNLFELSPCHKHYPLQVLRPTRLDGRRRGPELEAGVLPAVDEPRRESRDEPAAPPRSAAATSRG